MRSDVHTHGRCHRLGGLGKFIQQALMHHGGIARNAFGNDVLGLRPRCFRAGRFHARAAERPANLWTRFGGIFRQERRIHEDQESSEDAHKTCRYRQWRTEQETATASKWLAQTASLIKEAVLVAGHADVVDGIGKGAGKRQGRIGGSSLHRKRRSSIGGNAYGGIRMGCDKGEGARSRH